jgi:hypothetical protein
MVYPFVDKMDEMQCEMLNWKQRKKYSRFDQVKRIKNWKQRKNYLRRAIDLTVTVNRVTVFAALDEMDSLEVFIKRFD